MEGDFIMGLFNFGKKKEGNTKSSGCCCGGNCNEETMEKAKSNQTSGPRVKILGSGCAKCNDLEENVVKALKELGESTEVEHVTDFVTIASYGVMTTPALVVDGKVISYGKVLKVEEAVKLIKEVI